MCLMGLSVTTAQRHVGLRVLHSITRHSHWKRCVWSCLRGVRTVQRFALKRLVFQTREF